VKLAVFDEYLSLKILIKNFVLHTTQYNTIQHNTTQHNTNTFPMAWTLIIKLKDQTTTLPNTHTLVFVFAFVFVSSLSPKSVQSIDFPSLITIEFIESGNDAAGVGLLGLFVEHLTLPTEIVAPLHKLVQFHSPLQHIVNGLVEYLSGVIEVPLDLGDFVCRRRVLEAGEVIIDGGEGHVAEG